MRFVLLLALGALLVPPRPVGAQALDATAALTLDAAANVRGGVERSAGWLANLDLTARLDGDQLGWPGGAVFLYLLGNAGNQPSSWVGDYQLTDNIEAPEAFRLFEAWVEQRLWGDRASLLVGLRDLNAGFHVVRRGELFLNSSVGIGAALGQTGANGPAIFPNSAPAVRLRVEPRDGIRLRVAAFDAVANDPGDPSATRLRVTREEGALLIGELEVLEATERWRLLGGGFRYTEPAPDREAGAPSRRDDGLYAVLEGRLARTETIEVQGFVHWGTADDRIYDVGRGVVAGVVTTGLFGRPRDRIGAAVAATDGPTLRGRETAWELTYEWVVRPLSTIRLDAQWVAFDGGRSDALILTTRVALAVTR